MGNRVNGKARLAERHCCGDPVGMGSETCNIYPKEMGGIQICIDAKLLHRIRDIHDMEIPGTIRTQGKEGPDQVGGLDDKQHGPVEDFYGCHDGAQPVPSLAVFSDSIVPAAQPMVSLTRQVT